MKIITNDHLYTQAEQERFRKAREGVVIMKLGETAEKNTASDEVNKPLFSVIVPVFKTPLPLLDEMISSVAAQSFPKWELLLGNASPEDEALSERLEKWAQSDERIRVLTLSENKGISGNTNAIFAEVSGEYVAMLDHDDLLTEDALFYAAKAVEEGADFIYSDQDMVDEKSKQRFNPLRKPDWSPATLYSGNYITHFSVLKTELIKEIGGWDPDTDGAQDWDLFLRASRAAKKIKGIPHILYHWRMASTSTASSMETKSYALDAQIQSLRNHLDAMGEERAEVFFYDRSIYKIRVKWNHVLDQRVSVILHDETGDGEIYTEMIRAAFGFKVKEIVTISEEQIRSRFEAYKAGINELGDVSKDAVLFMSTRVLPFDAESLRELAQWVFCKDTVAAAPMVLSRKKAELPVIASAGFKDTRYGLIPLHEGEFVDGTTIYGKNYWYRNVFAFDDNCFALKGSAAGCLKDANSMLSFYKLLKDTGLYNVMTPYSKVTKY